MQHLINQQARDNADLVAECVAAKNYMVKQASPTVKSCAMTKAAANARDYPASPSPIERLRTEGIRAMSNADHEKMAEAGFNLSLGWKRLLTGSTKSTNPDSQVILREEDFSERAVKQLREWALKCKKND